MSTNQGSPMTPHADLVARLRAIAARFDMTSTERYEQDAEAFYAATGYMAPGKDVPMAMGGQNEAERRAAHEAWVVGRNRSQQQAIQEAADALSALPPPAETPDAPQAEAEHAPLCDDCGEPLVCPAGTAERIAGLESMHEQTLTRAEQAEAALTSRPADPPALVALVREIQDERRLTPEGETSARMMALAQALLAYPLPAAPLVTEKE